MNNFKIGANVRELRMLYKDRQDILFNAPLPTCAEWHIPANEWWRCCYVLNDITMKWGIYYYRTKTENTDEILEIKKLA